MLTKLDMWNGECKWPSASWEASPAGSIRGFIAVAKKDFLVSTLRLLVAQPVLLSVTRSF